MRSAATSLRHVANLGSTRRGEPVHAGINTRDPGASATDSEGASAITVVDSQGVARPAAITFLAWSKAFWHMIMPIAGVIMVGYTLRDLWLYFHGQMALAGQVVKEGYA